MDLRKVNTRISINRRAFLQYTGVGLISSLFAKQAEGANFMMKKFLALPPKTTPFITSNENFYIVNYSRPPHIDPNGWSLEISGRVERPLHLSYQEILKRPPIEKMVTLQCIDNEVAGELISNAVWKGVSLRSLIEEARPHRLVEDVAMYGADLYFDSITLDRAMNYDVFLAYEMNGRRLSKEHGFPLRAVVPGLYGIKNVKWLNKIELVDHDFKGYWQQKGWTDEGSIKVTSRIDTPGPYNTVTGDYTLSGIAFSGYNGIRDVELSFDGGKRWTPSVIEPSPSPYSWVAWKYRWKNPKPGAYQISVKATDRIGRNQTDFIARAFPDGTSGLHSVVIFVE